MKQVYIKKINSELEYLKDKLSETEYLEFVNTGILKFYNFLVKNETLQIFLSMRFLKEVFAFVHNKVYY